MTDTLTMRLAIAVLGLIAVATVVGGLVLANNDKTLPGELIAIGAGAAGAVAGLITRPAN